MKTNWYSDVSPFKTGNNEYKQTFNHCIGNATPVKLHIK